MKQSPAIQQGIELALAEGNEVVQTSTGWEKVDEVVHFRQPMTSKVRDALSDHAALRYWLSEGPPHNQPQEGFADSAAPMALAFPISA